MAAVVTLTILNGPLRGRWRRFTRTGRCVIGRSDECELRLPSGPEFLNVSRLHCELDLDPPAVRVRDLGSRNGTTVNGTTIGGRQTGGSLGGEAGDWHALKGGDELRIGDTFLRVEVSAGVGQEAAGQPAGLGSGL